MRHKAAFTRPVERSTIGVVPFRQIFTVLLALIAILMAALFVLSWDGDDGDDTVTPDDSVDDTSTTIDDDGTTTTTTTTIAPVTTSIPIECGTAEEPIDTTTTADSTTTTTTTTTTEAGDDDDEPELPTEPTLGRNSSLSTVGLDTVAFGLTVNQASAQSGHEMIACGAVTDCYRVTPADAPTGISFVVDNGTIERVDIVGESPITTLSGAGIGTTEEKLDDLFGDRLEREDLGAGRTDVIFVPSDENDQEFRVVFTVLDGVVETMRSGRVPLVLEHDACV